MMSGSTGTANRHIDITKNGNLILDIYHKTEATDHHVALRVDTTSLCARSKYFERLLRAGRFGEGTEVQTTLTALLLQYASITEVPVDKLPVLRIDDIGRISAVKSLQPLLVDFFTILCGQDIATLPPVANLANLAVVADRFDALPAVAAFVKRKKFIKSIDSKTTSKQDVALTEGKVRQRVLVGVLLDHPPWVEKYTARLIIKGIPYTQPDLDAALWWQLPSRLEEEITLRRECVLQTIQDLQFSFLTAYSTRTRQCRLGYDSSPECDSFQFGEMVRFFLKTGTLQLQGTLHLTDDMPLDYDGDLLHLIERLKQVPEYQVDRNHSHCGIRTRIVPLLDLVATSLHASGICGECWLENRSQHAWVDSKRPLSWEKQRHGNPGAVAHHESRHDIVRAFFMAEERDWS